MNINEFLKDRHNALVRATMDDDWEPFRSYCKKYMVPIPKSEKVMKAGCYKAVQECNDISDAVKKVAFEKCVALGFSPLFTPEGETEWLN